MGGIPKLKSAGPEGHEGAGATEDVEGWDPEAVGVTPNLMGDAASGVAVGEILLKSAGPEGHAGAGAAENVEGWDPEAVGVTPNLKGAGASGVAGWPE